MCIMCVCLLSALGRRVGALQISTIIIIIMCIDYLFVEWRSFIVLSLIGGVYDSGMNDFQKLRHYRHASCL